MLSRYFKNWLKLLGFTLRRDRFMLPAWMIGVVLFSAGFTPFFESMMGTKQEAQVMFETMKSPAMVAMCGKVYGTEPTIGLMTSIFMLVWSAVLIGVMNIFLVARHTRKDEEDGRLEVIKSLPVGKSANLLSITKTAFIANLLIAVMIGGFLVACNIKTVDAAGSFVYGASIGVFGLFMAAMTALIAQLSSTSKGTIGLSMFLLGILYLMRAAGDLHSETLARISPLGMVQRTESFINNYVWPLLVVLGLSIIVFIISFALNYSRDFGQGLVPARGGRAHAGKMLGGEFGLALRLCRGVLIAWATSIFVLSAAYGSVFGDLQNFYKTNDLFKMMMGTPGIKEKDMIDPIVSMLTIIMAIIVTIAVVAILFKIKGEENSSRLEQVYSKSVSRVSNFLSYIIISSVGAAVMLFLVGFGMWVTSQSVMKNPVSLIFMTKCAMCHLPAVLAIIGFGALLIGLIPKLTMVVYAYIGYSFLAVYMGALIKMPDWAIHISPFGIIPRYPEDDYTFWPAFGLSLAFVVLSIAGLICYRRRNIDTN